MTNLIQFIALIFSIILHEMAHGWAAYLLGDRTAKRMGRLTLNPIPHIDPLGSILLPGLSWMLGSPVLLGWAKPVPVNPGAFKHPLSGMMWVALAGPLTNFLIATVGFFLLKNGGVFLSQDILLGIIYMNIFLGTFNLLPIPPLDGSRILAFFLPENPREILYKIEPYGFAIIFGLAYFGVLNTILMTVLKPVLRFLFGAF